MPIPDFQSFMLPLLQFAEDGQEHALRDAYEHLAQRFDLTPEELSELLPSGRQTTFHNRVSWSKTHLKKAGLFESTRRGFFRITERGRQALNERPSRVDVAYLKQFPSYQAFRARDNIEEAAAASPRAKDVTEQTPEEVLYEAHSEIRSILAQELLEQILNSSPRFFEMLVVDLLVSMGYGGSHQNAARAVGQSGDEGIDGIIDEDRLGLDTIYIQAKRWQNTVSRPEIQKFVGALQGRRARKGIFITTSNFSQGARDYVKMIETKVVLISGTRLAEYMIDYNVGVSIVNRYEIKRLDSDYFGDE